MQKSLLTLPLFLISFICLGQKNDSIWLKSLNSINIEIESKDLNHWRYDISPLLIDSEPIPLTVKVSGAAALSEDAQQGDINAITRFMSGDDLPEIIWNISAYRDNSTDLLKVDINGKPDFAEKEEIPIETRLNDLIVTILSPEFNAHAEYTEDTLSASYHFIMKNIEAANSEMSFSTPLVSIEGNIAQSEGMKDKYVSNFSIGMKKITFK